MKKIRFLPLTLILLVVASLVACNLPGAGITAPTSQVNVIGTAAAQTVAAQLTQAPTTPAPQGVTPAAPSATKAPPTNAPSPTKAPTTAAPTTAATAQNTPSSGGTTPCDRAEFVTDVTYPDGSLVSAGSSFVKTWRFKNNGTCTWNSSYALVFVSGDAMNGPASVQLTNGQVAPGANVDVSVTLKAPSSSGSYQGNWKLRNASSQLFGIGADASTAFWVNIKVPGAASRLSFVKGATSANASGNVDKNSRASYLVNAAANQYMMVQTNSASSNLAIEVQSPSGSYLVKASDKKSYWQGTLPSDGDYLISIVNSGDTTSYNFTVTIPVRVKFASGAVSDSEDGIVAANSVNTYLLKAMKDQTMTVTLDTTKTDVVLAIYGLSDGTPYLRRESGKTTYSFDLPATQDYVIQVFSSNGSTVTYKVTFLVK